MFDDMKNIVGNTTDNLIEVSKPRQLTKEYGRYGYIN
jgi:hypothetical protein